MKNNDEGIPLEKDENLEEWLQSHDADFFPRNVIDKNERPYHSKYSEFRNALIPIHKDVEIGAMAEGAKEWFERARVLIKESKDEDKKRLLEEQIEGPDPIIYLNNHGEGHVDKVIVKVSELLQHFERGHLTPYEGFFLLCAIQLHDIGNVFGRKNHEKNCKAILEEKGKPFITDSFERKIIEKLALVHGGAYNGNRDTIGCLSVKKHLHERYIRKRLIAALLRFGDEMADDSSRANKTALEENRMLPGSLIYHRYSEALHTVKIIREQENEKLLIDLSFDFDSNIAAEKFIKNGTDTYLLDEIYDRTLKMEQERRYCMRFLRPCLSLDGIRVEIVIQDAENPFRIDKIQYTLEETGYPINPASGTIKEFQKDLRTGEEEINYLNKLWI